MDISKCDGVGCDRKETCYRYTAKADPIYQSYIRPINRGEKCEDYWKVEEIEVRSDKLNSPIDENYNLRKENDELFAEIKFLRKRVSSLENEIAKRNKRIDKVLEAFDRIAE